MAQIKATRMEYLRLKKRLKTAQRGYKLLKEKRDGLMKKFMFLAKKAKEGRAALESILPGAFSNFAFAAFTLSQEELETMFALPEAKLSIIQDKENVMNVIIPNFQTELKGGFRVYSDFSAPFALEMALEKFWQAFEVMIELAGLEHSLRLLSFEIEKTRRRVNGLEYVIIPKMQSQLKLILAKLDEQERSDKVYRLIMKDIISAE